MVIIVRTNDNISYYQFEVADNLSEDEIEKLIPELIAEHNKKIGWEWSIYSSPQLSEWGKKREEEWAKKFEEEWEKYRRGGV